MKQYVSEARRRFYKSKLWERCRIAYLKKRKYICERCGETARIVHHKKYITDENLYDPTISLDENNLECLCYKCHNEEHQLLGRMLDGSKNYKLNKWKQQGRRFFWNDKNELTPL